MDAIKKDNFRRSNPDLEFPPFRSLSPEETDKVRHKIAEKLRLPLEITSLELVRALREKSTIISDTTAESRDFNLEATIVNAKIIPRPRVYLNWNRFDKIDEIDLLNLSSHFDDIWYPAVDDVDIFDETLDWVISIGYLGELLVLIFDKDKTV